MSNNEDQSNNQDQSGEDRVDEIARTAGAALRRPAPADGMARVRSSRRRRRVAGAVAGASAVVVMVVGLFLVVGRGSDDDTLVSDTVPDVVSTDTGDDVAPGQSVADRCPSHGGHRSGPDDHDRNHRAGQTTTAHTVDRIGMAARVRAVPAARVHRLLWRRLGG